MYWLFVASAGMLALQVWDVSGRSGRMGVRMGAVVASAALLISAKAFAPHPLPAIGIVAVIAAAANWLAASKSAPAVKIG